MDIVEQLQDEIQKLEIRQVTVLRKWLDEYHEALWDKQFEEDVAAGRLDKLGAAALEEERAGKLRDL